MDPCVYAVPSPSECSTSVSLLLGVTVYEGCSFAHLMTHFFLAVLNCCGLYLAVAVLSMSPDCGASVSQGAHSVLLPQVSPTGDSWGIASWAVKGALVGIACHTSGTKGHNMNLEQFGISISSHHKGQDCCSRPDSPILAESADGRPSCEVGG